MKIPMLDLHAEYEYMKADIDAAIRRCLEHQQWILGPEVKELEDKIAEYIGVKHCIGTSSGTDALVLALRALAIKTKGQEYFDQSDLVITTPFTFTATGDAVLRAGATPLFVDIDPATYNIDPTKILEALDSLLPTSCSPDRLINSPLPSTHSKSRIVGILPVHLYGQSCQMDQIMSIAREYGLFVVEDVAQAFGAECQMNSTMQKVGSIGNVGCFSFFPSKNLGGFGDAGMISTNDDVLEDIIRMLLKHGGRDKYNVDHIGYNARLDTFQAAIVLAKLPYIDHFNARRRQIANFYVEGLKDMPEIVLPLLPSALSSLPLACDSHVFHQFTIRIQNGRRNWLQTYLKNLGIESMVYYPVPLHEMRLFAGRCEVYGDLKESEKAAKEILSLPIEPLQKEWAMAKVVKNLKGLFASSE